MQRLSAETSFSGQSAVWGMKNSQRLNSNNEAFASDSKGLKLWSVSSEVADKTATLSVVRTRLNAVFQNPNSANRDNISAEYLA